MSDLAGLQRAFSTAVRGDDNGALPTLVDNVDRLAIYRNTVQGSLAEVLAAAFPVVRRIVGPLFFDDLCRRHIAVTPPRRAHLSTYGAEFPAFLAGDMRLAELPYLADTARLEWARGEAYFAADALALKPAALGAIAEDELAGTRVTLHPAARLIRSAYPIAHIWRVNQPEVLDVPAVDMSRAENVMISRPALRVILREVSAGDAAFIRAVAAGANLGEALDHGQDEDAAFDAEAALRDHLINGSFADLNG